MRDARRGVEQGPACGMRPPATREPADTIASNPRRITGGRPSLRERAAARPALRARGSLLPVDDHRVGLAGEPGTSLAVGVDLATEHRRSVEGEGPLAVGGDHDDASRVLRGGERVPDHAVGGLIVSIGSPVEVATKLNLLQELAEVPLLIAADMEHGPGQRLDGGVVLPSGLILGGGTRFPPIMALGATDSEDLAYEVGRITAIEGRAAGVHITFAPVVDVNNNPSNPIINTRSYGEDPALVARLGAAHIRGLQENGVFATANHFPGHGDTETDSHMQLPFLNISRSRADSVELVPFRAAVAAGVAGVMIANVAFPMLTHDSVPATISPMLTDTLLQAVTAIAGLVAIFGRVVAAERIG